MGVHEGFKGNFPAMQSVKRWSQLSTRPLKTYALYRCDTKISTGKLIVMNVGPPHDYVVVGATAALYLSAIDNVFILTLSMFIQCPKKQ